MFTITPEMLLLVSLLLENAISAAFTQVRNMTPEQVKAEIAVQEARKAALMDELNSH